LKPPDTFRRIALDAVALVKARGQRLADAAKPHVTLDNAIKVATVAQLTAQTISTVMTLPKKERPQ